MRRRFILPMAMGLILAGASCSNSGNSGNSTPTPPSTPPTATGITVSPSSVTLPRGATQQFTASVSGVEDQSVVWSVNGIRGGSSTSGLISADGLYIAPTAIPNSTVTVTARPFSSSTVSDAASVTIQAGSNVAVVIAGSGARTAVPTFGTHAFSVTVTGNENTSVLWQVNGVTGGSSVGGTITAAGVYTAPHSVPVSTLPNNDGQAMEVIVTAVSQADASASDSAIVVPVPPQQRAYTLPVPLGTSGGNAQDTSVSGDQTFCCSGTLGSLLSREGLFFILSNTHVLARSDLASAGEAIVQPGLIETRCSSNGTNLVGTLTQFFNLENGPAPHVDAAIAEVAGNAVDPQGTILQLGGTADGGLPSDGTPNPGSGFAPSIGRPVAKSGSATGITCGSIIAIDASIRVTYQKGCSTGTTFTVTYSNQIDITGVGFSAAGDSGSLIVTQDTADPVGLLYGGSDADTVANPVSDVLQQLADPVTAALPQFAGDAAVGAHPVAACTLLLQQFEPALNPQAGVAGLSALAQESAAAALDAHAAELLSYPGVRALGVGASLDEPGDPAILIFVMTGAATQALPLEVGGIRTRIIEGESFGKSGRLTDAESAALERTAPPARLVYPVSESEVLRARSVVDERAAGLMARRGVQGVGVTSSLDSPGEAALMIFVIRGVPRDPVPALIDGVRTRLRETSRFRAR